MRIALCLFAVALVPVTAITATAQDKAKKLSPTHANVSYGPHRGRRIVFRINATSPLPVGQLVARRASFAAAAAGRPGAV